MVIPSTDDSRDKSISWKISFMTGGTGVVLRAFLKLMEQHRETGGLNSSRGLDFVENAHHAFVDPSDPTVVYVTQPKAP